MPPIVTRYPLDPTGTSANNLVEDEVHDLGARPIRAFPTNYGGFYTESVVVTEVATQLPLVKGVDYYPAELYEVPSYKYGKEICSVIVLTNANISTPVSITYQAVGGPYSTSQQALLQIMEQLNLDDRPVRWGDIIDKPPAFNPAHHLHDAGDIYGFEYIVAELERIRQAILMGDVASHDAIYKYIDDTFGDISTSIAAVQAGLTAHLADFNNPHHTSAAQLGVYTQAQVDALIANLTNLLKVTVVTLPVGASIDRTYNNKFVLLQTSSVAVLGNTFQKDDVVYLRANQACQIVPANGLTLNVPAGQNTIMNGAQSTVALVFRSTTNADLMGVTQLT